MIEIYTDGSYKPKTNQGGYGCVILIDGIIKNILQKGFINTTNNRQELLAVLNALKFFKTPQEIKIYSDSNYVIGNIKYIESWINNTKDKKNMDIWKDIYKLINFHTVEFIWIKGHSKSKYNELADLYAHISSIVLNPEIDIFYGK